VYVQYEQGGCF